MRHPKLTKSAPWVGCLVSLLAGGCAPLTPRHDLAWEESPPHVTAGAPADLRRTPVPIEKNMMTLPEYVIEPPDIVTIDALKLIPKPPYRIESLDILEVNATGTREGQPIAGNYSVDPGGAINLGAAYGWVRVGGMTLEEAARAVEDKLKQSLTTPRVTLTLASSAGQQPIAGPHLVGPDGTVNLGIYGKVYITGMTVPQARKAIETHLSDYLDEPSVGVDVFTYNSKFYYVISEQAGFGDTVQSFQITGNETVLDALVKVNGRSRYNSKKIWISRPAPDGVSCDQILPVNWTDITQGAATATNYQVLPGDRIFIAEDRLISLNSAIARLTAPFESLLNFTILGTQTIQNTNSFPGGRSDTSGF